MSTDLELHTQVPSNPCRGNIMNQKLRNLKIMNQKLRNPQEVVRFGTQYIPEISFLQSTPGDVS